MKKIQKPKNQYELIHQWCNGLIDNYTKNSIKIENDELYYYNQLVAYIKKGKLYVEDFYRRGSFGNGYTSHYIALAFKGSKRDKHGCLKVSDLKAFRKLRVEKDKLVYCKEVLDNTIKKDNNFWCAIVYKNKLKSKRSSNFYNITDPNIDIPHEIKYLLTDKQLNKLLNKTVNLKGYVTEYINWSDKNYWDYNITAKYLDLLHFTFSTILDKDERHEIEFRIWRNDYLKNNRSNFLFDYYTSKEIYNDEVEREKYELRYKDRLKKLNEYKRIEEFKDTKKSYYKTNRKIVQFINGETLNHLGFSYNFRYLTLNENGISTSSGVYVSFDEAKKLYKLIKKINTPVNMLRLKLTIGGYYLKGINYIKKIDYIESTVDNIVEKDILCLQVGCHNIPIKHIHWFIKRNFPEWLIDLN